MTMMQSPMSSSPELMDSRFSQLRLPASSSSKFTINLILINENQFHYLHIALRLG